ncbi:hypothetical protein, partial [Klebsiella pneumoniae]|uniref:hypothetical protein n=1 Tax=Klebsiella pneumoniae TaxID=573 RepID=UPI0031B642C1
HQQKGMISLSPPTICNSAHPAEPESVRLIDNRVLLAYLYGAFCLVMEINAIIDFRPFCFYK